MLEKLKNTLDKGKYVGAVFMDLSKAFDSINHDLLEVYKISYNVLLFIFSYLKNRSQRVSINRSFSIWEEIIARIPQEISIRMVPQNLHDFKPGKMSLYVPWKRLRK